jgi:hypothetical protein
LSAVLPWQIEVFESPGGAHFRLPPPAGSWSGARLEVCVTADGKLRWQTGSAPTEVAVGDLACFLIGPFAHLAVLSVETRRGTTHAVCSGYPHDWLAALAAELSRRCRVPMQDASGPRPSPSTLPPATAEQEEPDQPPSSRVVCQPRHDGVTLIVPPGPFGLFVLLGLALSGFAVLFTLGGLSTGFRTEGGNYGPVLVVVVTWAIALAVLLPAYHNSRARVVLTVAGDRLEMLESSPVRTRRRSWDRAELDDVRCGDNGWVSGGDDSNMTSVAQLHILPKREKRVGLLTGRDPTEVRWIATVLRRALRLPHGFPGAS